MIKHLIPGLCAVLVGCAGPEEPDELAEQSWPLADYGEAMGMHTPEEVGLDALTTARAASTTRCPTTATVQGVDVSVYQGRINWKAVKASGRHFAFLRSSDGTRKIDPSFATHWRNAKAAGLVVGAYQFFRPNEDPIAQADLLVRQLAAVNGLQAPALPPVLDVETNTGLSDDVVFDRVAQWMVRVEARTGRRPVLYTSPGYWNARGSPTLPRYPYLWTAHWGVTCPRVPTPWTRFRFWQFSDHGTVPGISGPVDLDLYNGSLAELKAL